MPSLRETKDRIGSVKSTLKITSAMKLVASAKLRKSQQAIATILPYQKEIAKILSCLRNSGCSVQSKDGAKVAVVAISSNSSLCGGFNANIIKAALAELGQYSEPEVYAIGRKMSDALSKAGYSLQGDFNTLLTNASYENAGEFTQQIVDRYLAGEYSKVVLVYNHFVSTSTQKVTVEQFLPLEAVDCSSDDEYILEPTEAEIVAYLLPKVLKLKVYSVILDSTAAENAARTVAMQTATDNAEDLLDELTLEYNKGRQQKITNEILDLVGGMQE